MLRWLRENGLSLFLSIALSLVIWVVAVRQQDPIDEREYPIPVSIGMEGLAEGLVISGEYTHEVQVSLRASESTWNGLRPQDIRVVADLSSLPAGTHSVPLTVMLPEGTQALNTRTVPAQISVTLEELREREVPVQVTVEGEPALGFSVGDPQAEPSSVSIVGPLSEVDRVSEVGVTVDVSDMRESVQVSVEERVLDSDGQQVTGLDVTPGEVEINVPIDRLPNFKEVAVIVSTEGAPAFGYFVSSINVIPLSVTVQGSPDVINAMPGFVGTTSIDLTGVRDSFTREAGLELPEGVVAVDFTSVEARVEIDAFQGSLAVQQPLEVVGLRPGLEAVLSPETVEIILSGSRAALDVLTSEDLRVVLDLTDLQVGTYQIEPKIVTLPEGINSESLLPATVEVRIQIVSSAS